MRIIKRESEKRQRDKTKRSPFDDGAGYAAVDEYGEDELQQLQQLQPHVRLSFFILFLFLLFI